MRGATAETSVAAGPGRRAFLVTQSFLVDAPLRDTGRAAVAAVSAALSQQVPAASDTVRGGVGCAVTRAGCFALSSLASLPSSSSCWPPRLRRAA